MSCTQTNRLGTYGMSSEPFDSVLVFVPGPYRIAVSLPRHCVLCSWVCSYGVALRRYIRHRYATVQSFEDEEFVVYSGEVLANRLLGSLEQHFIFRESGGLVDLIFRICIIKEPPTDLRRQNDDSTLS